MGGYLSTMPLSTWIGGFNASYIKTMTEGDFYEGIDKDLLETVTPILNSNKLVTE
jgi:hypothetical protein